MERNPSIICRHIEEENDLRGVHFKEGIGQHNPTNRSKPIMFRFLNNETGAYLDPQKSTREKRMEKDPSSAWTPLFQSAITRSWDLSIYVLRYLYREILICGTK